MKKYTFKENGGEKKKKKKKTLVIKGWGYKMLPSGSYMVLNSCFYDKNPIISCMHWCLAKVEEC